PSSAWAMSSSVCPPAYISAVSRCRYPSSKAARRAARAAASCEGSGEWPPPIFQVPSPIRPSGRPSKSFVVRSNAILLLSKTKIAELLALAARPAPAGAQQLPPEVFVVAARAHGQGHGHPPAQEEHLFLGLQPGEHAAQRVAPGQPREHG